MTALELAEKELKKAHINLEQATKRRGVTQEELQNLQALVELRTTIVKSLSNNLSENKRIALAKVKDALDFQVMMCNATSTTTCTMPLTHAIFVCHIAEDLLKNGGKL